MITCIVLCDCVDSVSERWITEYIFTSKLSAENPQRGSSSQQWTLREVESACAWHMPLVSSFVIVVSARPPQLPSHHRFSLWHTTTFWPLADSHLLAPTFSLAALLFLPLGRSLTVVVCAYTVYIVCVCVCARVNEWVLLQELYSGQGEKSFKSIYLKLFRSCQLYQCLTYKYSFNKRVLYGLLVNCGTPRLCQNPYNCPIKLKCKGAVCRIEWHLVEWAWQKWNILFKTMF